MKNLPVLRSQIVIAFCIITISTAGCSLARQKVNADLLEQSRGKTFKLGIVKAAGDEGEFDLIRLSGSERKPVTTDEFLKGAANDITGPRAEYPLSSSEASSLYFGYITKAVENIPATEISSQLSSQYSITIDANVDKTVRVGKEQRIEQICVPRGRPQDNNKCQRRDVIITSLNAQYGHPDSMKEFHDVVNVTYSIASVIPIIFIYDIDIISSGQRIVTLHGTVANKFNANLDSYVYHAGRISEVLKRDLAEAAKRDLSKDNSEALEMLKRDLRPF